MSVQRMVRNVCVQGLQEKTCSIMSWFCALTNEWSCVCDLRSCNLQPGVGLCYTATNIAAIIWKAPVMSHRCVLL